MAHATFIARLWKGVCMAQAEDCRLAGYRQWRDGAAAQEGVREPEVAPLELSQSLPCGMAGCHQPTTRALVEQDAQYLGLWRLLPICPACAEDLSAAPFDGANASQSVGAC